MAKKKISKAAPRRSQPASTDRVGFLIVAFFSVLPLIFSIDGFDNFRLPKDVFSTISVLVIGVVLLLSRPLRPISRWLQVVVLGLVFLFVHCLFLGRGTTSWLAFYQVAVFVGLLLVITQLATSRLLRLCWAGAVTAMALNAVLTVLQSLGYFPALLRVGGEDLQGRLTPAGLVGDVNTGGFLFGLAILFSGYALLAESSPRIRLLAAVGLLFNGVGLLFTRTLTALAATGFCFLIWLVFHHWWHFKHQKSRSQLAPLWAALVVLLIGGSLVAVRTQVTDRISVVYEQLSTGDLTLATAGRQPVYSITWQMITEQPWLGRGLNSFGQDFFFQRAETDFGRQQKLINQPGAFREVHNEYLQVWVETGVIGFLFFIGLLFSLLFTAARHAWRGSDPRQSYWAAAHALAIIFVMISSLTFFPFHVSAAAGFIVLIVAGIRLLVPGSEESVHTGRRLWDWIPSAVPARRWVALLLPIALILWPLWWQVSKWRANRQLAVAAFLLERARAEQNQRRLRMAADEAAFRLERTKALYPHFAEIPNLMGSAAMLLGRHQQAREHYLEATRFLPSPEVFTNLAAAHLSAGETEQARPLLELALRYNPDYEPAQHALEFVEKSAR